MNKHTEEHFEELDKQAETITKSHEELLKTLIANSKYLLKKIEKLEAASE